MNRAEYRAYFEAIRENTPELFEKMVQEIAKYEPTIARALHLRADK